MGPARCILIWSAGFPADAYLLLAVARLSSRFEVGVRESFVRLRREAWGKGFPPYRATTIPDIEQITWKCFRPQASKKEVQRGTRKAMKTLTVTLRSVQLYERTRSYSPNSLWRGPTRRRDCALEQPEIGWQVEERMSLRNISQRQRLHSLRKRR